MLKLVNSLFVHGDYERLQQLFFFSYMRSERWPFFLLLRNLIFKGAFQSYLENWNHRRRRMMHAKECRFIMQRDHPHTIFIFHLQVYGNFLKSFASEIFHALYFYGSDGGRSLNIFQPVKYRPQRSENFSFISWGDGSFHANKYGSSGLGALCSAKCEILLRISWVMTAKEANLFHNLLSWMHFCYMLNFKLTFVPFTVLCRVVWIISLLHSRISRIFISVG